MSKETRKENLAVLILIILVACNLRAPITSCGALTNTLRESLGLSAGMSGIITTAPILAFAIISPFAFIINRKLGMGKSIFLSILLLNVGIAIRSFAGEIGLFIGIAFIGLGIGVCNVLLPAIIKDSFPNRIGEMTSMYTAIMQVMSTIATAIAAPMSLAFGWKIALFAMIVIAIAALICCVPNIKITTSESDGTSIGNNAVFFASPMTWWVTAYMGVQSLVFYSLVAWLSPIMQSKGYTLAQSGLALSLYIIMGFLGSCALPFIMKRNKSQSFTGLQIGIAYFIGMILMIFAGSLPLIVFAIMLCGFLSGTCISFVMALFGLHTSCGEAASKLSAFAQGLGYLVASSGPVIVGKLYETSTAWTVPLAFLLLCSAFIAFLGYMAGRDKIIM